MEIEENIWILKWKMLLKQNNIKLNKKWKINIDLAETIDQIWYFFKWFLHEILRYQPGIYCNSTSRVQIQNNT